MLFSRIIRFLQISFIFLLCVNKLVSQTQAPYQRDFSPKTPEAATLNKYGDYSVGYFTGKPNISIPISASEEVPIELSYDASGHKPEQHHGWVGLGWNLGVGGMITRIKRSLVDEYKSPATGSVPIGYFDSYTRLQGAEPDWDISLVAKKASDDPNDSEALQVQAADLEPDEFVFNFGSYSGSFMLNHQGVWVFRGNNPEEFLMKPINIGHDILFNLTPEITHHIPRMILGFTIVTKDGTEYTFGGDFSSIDFTLTPDAQRTTLQDAINASAWHLVKIKEVSGKEINFTYQKDGFSLVINNSRNLGASTKTAHSNLATQTISESYANTGVLSANILFNSYLTEIETPYELTKFSREKLSGYADFGNLLPTHAQTILTDFGIEVQSVNEERKWYKLTEVKTFVKPYTGGSQKPIKDFVFNYGLSPSNRLQLQNVRQINVDNTTDFITTAAFSYNPNPLPAYNTAQIDHWGYYNGKGMFDPNGASNPTTDVLYFPSREPNTGLAKNEILEKITYPTGGYTDFEYQSHDYSTCVLKSTSATTAGYPAFPIENLASDFPTGGLRIYKIKNNDGVNEIVREFIYKKSYVPNSTVLSSGILDGKPRYYDTFNGTIFDRKVGNSTIPIDIAFTFFNEQSLNPLNMTNGSPVSYSEVVEKLSDGSYTIYKFSNHDNVLYRNRTVLKTAFSHHNNLPNSINDPIIDFGQLRGRLLEQKVYNSSNSLVKYTLNEYSNSLDSSIGVRGVGLNFISMKVPNSLGQIAFLNLHRSHSYVIHTSPAFLKKSTTTDYYYNGATVSQVAIVTENSYDDYKNIIEQKVTNLNDAETRSNVTTTYHYAYDNATDVSESTETQGTKALMVQKFMIGIPLVTKNNFNKGSKVEYKSFSVPVITVVNGTPTTVSTNTALLPYLFYEQNKTGGFTEQFRINSYQDYDKPTQTKAKGTNTPVVDYVWQDGLLKTKKYGTGINLLTWTFYYDFAKRWLYSKKDENGLRAKFAYDGYRRLTTIQDRFNGVEATDFSIANPQNVQTTTTYNYHYKGQPIPTGAPTDDVNSNYVETVTNVLNSTSTVPLSTKQYLDGLGRPFMTYKYKYLSNTSHQKSYVKYDDLGRPYKVYQPFGESTEGVGTIPNGSDVKETIFEASPLNRPIKQMAEDGKYIEMQYGANTGDATEGVRKFSITYQNSVRTIATNGYYAANTLSRTTVWDENGQSTYNERGRTDTYKDKLGRVVLTRKYEGTNPYQKVETYNVYDDYGDLIMVIPPGAINSSGVIVTALVFEYTFDNEHSLIKKKVPNAEEVLYFYNTRDLLALTQDGNMRAAGKYLATVYDDLGRVVKTGFVTSNDPNNITILDAVNDPNRMSSTIYYDNSSWVKHQESKVLHHSDYTPIRNHVWSYIERRAGYTYTGNPIWTGKHHLLSETFRDGWDERGDEPILDNDYGGVDWSVSGYDGLQKPTLSIRYLYSGNQSQEVRQSQTFTYDNGQRLAQSNYMYALQGAGISATPSFILSKMAYNGRDLLTNKKTAQVNGKYLQSTDFYYNQRNWLTAINKFFKNSDLDYPLFSNANLSSSTQYFDLQNGLHTPLAQTTPLVEDNPDLFKEIIRYGDPSQIPAGVTTEAQYNGNISQIEYQVAGYEGQAYSFKYDNLDRMLEANYADIHSVWGASTPWANHYESDNKFQEIAVYDLRGNIQALSRKGLTDVPSTFPESSLMYGIFATTDYLSYGYDSNNANKLASVTENTNLGGLLGRGFKTVDGGNNNAAVADYNYDANGNITSDLNKNITGIEYNYLNLPTKISFLTSAGSTKAIYFVYDAAGQKHQKIVREQECGYAGCGELIETVYTYVNGIEYTNGVLQRFAHTEGSVALQADGSTYAHEYVIKDHLGNTRVTYRDDNTTASPSGTIKVEEIVQTNHYYPFGLNMEGTWNGSFPEAKNKYQYNGKELNTDFGLDWLDYGARFYDPSVSRWLGVDPLSEKMRRHSPYNYAFDNPMRFVDPDGMQNEDWVKGKNGKIYNDFEVTSKFEAWQKGVEYIGNNKLLVDKNTNAGYFLPFCSATAECWGQIGNPVTVTESSNAPAIRFGNPDYEPYNPEAVGFQISGSVEFITSSYSVSFGVGLGPGQAGIFMTTGAGTGPFDIKKPLSGSLSASVFLADRTNSEQKDGLSHLLNEGTSVSGTAGVFTGGYFQSASKGTLKPTDGYKGVNFGLSTPGGGIKVERTNTKGIIWKRN